MTTDMSNYLKFPSLDAVLALQVPLSLGDLDLFWFLSLTLLCALSQPGILQSFGKDEEVGTLSCLVSGMTGL